MIELSEQEKADYRRFAPSSCRTGHVHFEVCKNCGHPEWVTTNTVAPDDVSIRESASPCQRCREVYARAPEVVAWVTGMLAWRDRKAQPKRSELGNEGGSK